MPGQEQRGSDDSEWEEPEKVTSETRTAISLQQIQQAAPKT